MTKMHLFRWVVALVVLHAPILLAGFVAPYDPTTQHRLYPFAPPTRVHLIDGAGRVHLRPFYYTLVPSPVDPTAYVENSARAVSVQFFVRGDEYRPLALFHARLHLIGGAPDHPIFLLGTDAFGRDQLSRWLAGGQISVAAGLLAAVMAVGIGTLLGTLAGYFGGHIDTVVMRIGELFTALPWMYLLIAVRASLPLRVTPLHAFALVVLASGVAGWVRPGRLVRGLVMSARERAFVSSARGFGASDLYLLRAHVLPATYSALLTQLALAVPQFVVAEVMLSFLGLGLADPIPSWGTLLIPLQQYHVLVSYWWMFIPALLSTAVFLTYYRLADAVHLQLRPVAL